jgi:hypothetical protein
MLAATVSPGAPSRARPAFLLPDVTAHLEDFTAADPRTLDAEHLARRERVVL